MPTISRTQFFQLLETAICCFVAFHLFLYGGAKYLQFQGAADIPTPVNQLTGMRLMWAFYGYSQTFAIIIGILEILGGILLVLRPTRLFGALLLTTILVNIILQDIFYGVLRGALFAAITYQLGICIVLFRHRAQLLQIARQLWHAVPAITGPPRWLQLLLIGLLTITIKALEILLSSLI